MKHTIKWFERKIGKHDTNLLIFGVCEIGLITSLFLYDYSSFFALTAYLFIFLLGQAFERVNKPTKHKGAND